MTPAVTPGVSTACLYPMETERALETLLRLGYRRFEVFLNAMEELSPPFLRGLGERARAYGASFVSVHPFTSAAESTLLFGDYPRRTREGFDFYRRYLAAAAQLGARWVVIHGQPQGHGKLPDEGYWQRFGELYRIGYEEGAFTGARKGGKPGLFEFAHGGTLFLDEVEGMSTALQCKLLRVLQEREIMRVGGNRIISVDVRIIAATNRNLLDMVHEKTFREDLYYRLAEFEIRQPSLSECPEDILPLADFFREQYSEEIRVETSGFTEQAKISMLSHSWPGNVRELDNRIRRAVLLAASPLLTHKDLNLNATICRTGEKCKKGLMEEAEEKELIRKILEECGGKISRVARMLGMSRPTLYKKMERYGLR